MAIKKKSRKKKKVAPVEKKPVYRTITEEEHIELSIKFSERCIDGSGSSIDEFFKQQAARQKKKLEELRNKNEVSKKLP